MAKENPRARNINKPLEDPPASSTTWSGIISSHVHSTFPGAYFYVQAPISHAIVEIPVLAQPTYFTYLPYQLPLRMPGYNGV